MKHLIVLLAFLLMLLPEVRAWGEVQSPAYSFRSTSSLQSAGSGLPMAAVTGGGLAGDRPSYVGGIRPRMNTGREDSDDDDILDDGEITHTPDPDLPVGDGVLPLLLMAAASALSVWLRRRKTAGTGAASCPFSDLD